MIDYDEASRTYDNTWSVYSAVLCRLFLRNVRARNYSVFRPLPEAEQELCLAAMEKDREKSFAVQSSGSTLLWIERGGER